VGEALRVGLRERVVRPPLPKGRRNSSKNKRRPIAMLTD
jgi:hypothetical protein